MSSAAFFQTIFSLLIAGKIFGALKFIGYRIASWFSSIFFYHKGKESGRKRFYLIAILIWVVSWSIFLYLYLTHRVFAAYPPHRLWELLTKT